MSHGTRTISPPIQTAIAPGGVRSQSFKTVIDEKIIGVHWSVPRFFVVTKRASALAGAEAGR